MGWLSLPVLFQLQSLPMPGFVQFSAETQARYAATVTSVTSMEKEPTVSGLFTMPWRKTSPGRDFIAPVIASGGMFRGVGTVPVTIDGVRATTDSVVVDEGGSVGPVFPLWGSPERAQRKPDAGSAPRWVTA